MGGRRGGEGKKRGGRKGRGGEEEGGKGGEGRGGEGMCCEGDGEGRGGKHNYLVVSNEVIDGVKAHVIYQVVLGLATFRLGVNTTVIVLGVPPAKGEESHPATPITGLTVLTQMIESSLQ